MKKILVLICMAVFFISSCTNEEYAEDKTAKQNMIDSQQIQLASQAYTYGFPLVLMEIAKRNMLEQARGAKNLPLNQIINCSSLPGSSFRHFIKPDRDIYYSFAWLDLSDEAVVIEIPKINKLYYNFILTDAWTNVFYSNVQTEEKHFKFIVAGPRWSGKRTEENLPVYFSHTNTAFFFLRIRFADRLNISSEIDAIRKEIRIIPLSMYGKPYVHSAAAAGTDVFKGFLETVLDMKIEDFFNLLNETMLQNPPLEQDSQIIDRILDIGTAPGMRFETDLFSEKVLNEISKIPDNMRKFINASDLKRGDNGWTDYKSCTDYGNGYYLRMRDCFESFDLKADKNISYGITGNDSDGAVLNGANKYKISFEKDSIPPKKTSWGISLYDKSGFYETNAIKRNGIGYRNKLKVNDDGSIDIYIQSKSPGKDKESNWLPVNSGEFMLVFRSYSDEGRIINLPAVKKAR